jgi:[methyl-Co(III) methanol-specific corrinoid protein]:coenzyme M methyltransferase
MLMQILCYERKADDHRKEHDVRKHDARRSTGCKKINRINGSKPDLKQEFEDILEGKDVSRPLVGTVTTAGVLELMDICGSARPDADRDPSKMAQLAGSLHTVANLEVIRFPFDVTVLGEALGCAIDTGTKARTPAITSHPFSDRPAELVIPSDLLSQGRIPVVLEAARLLKDREGKKVPIVAGVEGPGDLASYLCGIKPLMVYFIRKPEIAAQVINKCVDGCISYSNACLNAGADAVVIADAFSSPDMIGPDIFRQLIKPELIRLAENIDGHSILHICGRTDSIIPDMLECGFNAISIEDSVSDLGQIIDMAHAKNVAVAGNISTSQTLYSKSPEDVRNEAFNCLKAGIDILAPGCGIAPETPLKNLHAMVKARDEYFG